MTANNNGHTKLCDRLSVGAVVEREVVVRDETGEIVESSTLVLIGDCATGDGWAGPARHIRDRADNGTAETVMRGNVNEETGLVVVDSEMIRELTWRGNLCARDSGPAGNRGHWWWLYRVSAEGGLTPEDRAFKSLHWAGKAELQRLADRALAYVRGEVTEEEWAEDPGMHPLWVLWFCLTGHVEMPMDGLSRINLWVDYRGLSNR